MRLGYVIHYVENVEDTLVFYERAFGCVRNFLTESGEYGELDTGETTLAFASQKMLREAGKTPGQADPNMPVSEIAFVTEDVDSAFKTALKNGAQSQQAPAKMPWGQTISYVSDLNGFWVEICTPVAG